MRPTKETVSVEYVMRKARHIRVLKDMLKNLKEEHKKAVRLLTNEQNKNYRKTLVTNFASLGIKVGANDSAKRITL